MNTKEKSKRTKNIGIATIALVSILLATCMTAAPAMAQEEIVWQHGAIMPWDAERLSSGNTLIAETGNNTVIEVNTTTKELVWQYGDGFPGSDPGQLESPVDAERLLSGNTLITDRNNHRVIEVNTTGAIVWQYGTTGTFGSGYDELYNPMDAERLPDGNTLIADRLNNRVIVVNESKGIVWQYGITNPFDADRLPDGNTLIAEYTNHRVIEINESDDIVWQYGDGTSGSGVNQLWYPMDAERLSDGNTLIADHTNDRVIEVRTSDYDPAKTDNGFTAASIVWEYVSNHPADADRLSSGSTLISEAGINNRVIEVVIGDVDLIPIAIETAPPALYAGLTLCEVTATMFNNGSDHSGGFNASLYADGIKVDTKVVDDIPAGDSRNVTLEWIPAQAGDYNLTVVADSDYAIVETNEENNELTIEVTVLPATVKRLTFDSGSSINPKVMADSMGNMHVVWSDDRDGNREIYYKKLDANRNVLMNDTRITNTSRSSIAPVVAIDSTGNAYIAWQEGTGSDYYYNDYHIYYTKLDSSGSVLVGATRIEETAYTYEFLRLHDIAVDSSGNIRLLWEQYLTRMPSNWNKVWYGRFDDSGSPLAEPICVGEVDGLKCDELHSLYPSFALDSSDNVHIAYSVRYKGIDCKCGPGFGGGWYWSDHECPYFDCLREIYYRKMDSDGTLHDALRLTDDNRTFASLTPDVSVDADDTVHVVWVNNNVTYDPDYMKYTWGGDRCMEEPGGYFDGHSYDLYYTKLDNNGNTLVDDTRMTFDCSPEPITKPSIDTGFGVTYIAWSASREVYYMAIDTSGGTLINMTLMSLDDGFDSWEPSLTACNDGAHVVWTDNRDGNNEIYYAKTEAPPDRFFILAPPDQFTAQNIVATYTVGILSTMSTTVTLNLTLDDLDGADVAELSDYTITIDPDSIGEVTLNVTDSRLGDYRVTVTVASQTMQDSATITTSVIVPIADLLITAVDAYHNDTSYPPYFNLSNEVDVTMKNVGTADAGTFNVELYVNDTLVDTQSVSGLEYGSYTTVQFKWTPVGMDCEDGGSPRTYTLKAIADCNDVISEPDETNNELTAEETAYWAGYSADEELVEASHGTIRGGLLYTTGDGSYVGLYNHGNFKDTHYNIELPAGAAVKHARLNVYYTWSKLPYPVAGYPVMEVSITNATGTYTVPLAASYNDRPCPSPAIGFEYPWGNYVYDLTPYITDSGSYTVRVKNNGSADNPSNFCPAAPGLVILYEDNNMPEYEYWILEGADVVEGGRRGGAGYLSLEECTNDAVFPRSIDLSKVSSATLGMVSIWGGEAWGEWTSHYWFNDNYLGDGRIMDGYYKLYDKTINGMSMFVGASKNAQVGANVSDVTDYIVSNDNVVTFGDNGDSMMPSNAFLLVERCRGEKPEPAVLVPFMISGSVFNYSDGAPLSIKNMNTGESFTVETRNGSNYYQVLTSLEKVSCGDVLRFTCGGTSVEHRVRQSEIDAGGFELNVTCTEGEIPPVVIEASVRIEPEILNLKNEGVGVFTAFITLLEEGYDVADIDINTTECEGAPALSGTVAAADNGTLVVKFSREKLRADLPGGDDVMMTVTGELFDGTPFEGSDTIRVIK